MDSVLGKRKAEGAPATDGVDYLSALPDEILTKIFGNLSLEDKIRAAGTSTRLKYLAATKEDRFNFYVKNQDRYVAKALNEARERFRSVASQKVADDMTERFNELTKPFFTRATMLDYAVAITSNLREISDGLSEDIRVERMSTILDKMGVGDLVKMASRGATAADGQVFFRGIQDAIASLYPRTLFNAFNTGQFEWWLVDKKIDPFNMSDVRDTVKPIAKTDGKWGVFAPADSAVRFIPQIFSRPTADNPEVSWNPARAASDPNFNDVLLAPPGMVLPSTARPYVDPPRVLPRLP